MLYLYNEDQTIVVNLNEIEVFKARENLTLFCYYNIEPVRKLILQFNDEQELKKTVEKILTGGENIQANFNFL